MKKTKVRLVVLAIVIPLALVLLVQWERYASVDRFIAAVDAGNVCHFDDGRGEPLVLQGEELELLKETLSHMRPSIPKIFEKHEVMGRLSVADGEQEWRLVFNSSGRHTLFHTVSKAGETSMTVSVGKAFWLLHHRIRDSRPSEE